MKALIVTSNPYGMISYYRASGPLHKMGIKYDFLNGEFDSKNIKKYDFVIMTQPYAAINMAIAKLCKEYSVPLWVDFDDLVTEVSIWNPCFLQFYGSEVKNNVLELISMADILTYSTEYLKNCLSPFKGDVVPNAFDTEAFSMDNNIGIDKKVIWRGSPTHDEDLYEFRKPIIKSINACPDWKINFVGVNPIFINKKINGEWTPRMNPSEYWAFLKLCTAKIFIVPLFDSNFNKSKSNIAWIEASYAGCVTLAPDWDEWRKDGVINYMDKFDFKNKLTDLMTTESLLEYNLKKSQDYIIKNLSLQKVNERRLQLLNRR